MKYFILILKKFEVYFKLTLVNLTEKIIAYIEKQICKQLG